MWIVTMPRLERALATAIADFQACGLYTDALHDVPVWWCSAGYAYGWCWESGDIAIPTVSLSRLGNKLMRRPRVALTDVLRHEMAHALAHLHAELVDTPSFKSTFGGEYWDRSSADHDPELHVTPYAATSPSEDFAETVMVYTRYRGRTDRFSNRLGVVAGMKFVRSLAGRLHRRRRSSF